MSSRWSILILLAWPLAGCGGHDQCYLDMDCGTCQVCVNGACVDDEACTACTSDEDCQGCQVCDQGACKTPDEVCDDGLDNDCDGETDEGCGDPCLGVVCKTPPGPTCDENTLKVFLPDGTCTAGECEYASMTFPCEFGCQDGACTGDPCTDVICDDPPDGCRVSEGVCVNGVCRYGYADGKICNDQDPCTREDHCDGGVCVGTVLTCEDPPPNTCPTGDTMMSYPTVGYCQYGECQYDGQTVTCASGCADGVCQGDPCSGVTCDQPPGECYLDMGTCRDGSCGYTAVDGRVCDDGNACTTNDACTAGSCAGVPLVCDQPPDDECQDANVLLACSRLGTCAAGTCDYECQPVTCTNGCNNGFCNGDPCIGVTCDQSPSECHLDTGYCSGGVCHYDTIDGLACNDADPCTRNDLCVDGVCTGVAYSCDDQNPCTHDQCDGTGGCANPPVPDGTECPGGGTCTAGDCVGPACTPEECDDDNTCTQDHCDPEEGCSNTNVTNGTSCDDGNPLTEDDACQNGQCVGSGSEICNLVDDDGNNLIDEGALVVLDDETVAPYGMDRVVMEGAGPFALAWGSTDGLLARFVNADGTPRGTGPIYLTEGVKYGAPFLRSMACEPSPGVYAVATEESSLTRLIRFDESSGSLGSTNLIESANAAPFVAWGGWGWAVAANSGVLFVTTDGSEWYGPETFNSSHTSPALASNGSSGMGLVYVLLGMDSFGEVRFQGIDSEGMPSGGPASLGMLGCSSPATCTEPAIVFGEYGKYYVAWVDDDDALHLTDVMSEYGSTVVGEDVVVASMVHPQGLAVAYNYTRHEVGVLFATGTSAELPGRFLARVNPSTMQVIEHIQVNTSPELTGASLLTDGADYLVAHLMSLSDPYSGQVRFARLGCPLP